MRSAASKRVGDHHEEWLACKQLRAVDVERLDSLAGRLTSSELLELDHALAFVLGLN